MNAADLLIQLPAAGDAFHLLAADALTEADAEAQRLRARVMQLEWVARLNAETVRNLQRAAIETLTYQSQQRGLIHAPAQNESPDLD